MPQPPAAQRLMEVSWQPYAECLSCTWEHPMSPVTRDRAKDHARYRNHKVRVVVEKVGVYARPDYDPANDRDDA